MEQFPHLNLVTKKTGIAKIQGGGGDPLETRKNKADRSGHSGKLQRWITDIKSAREAEFIERESKDLAPLDKDIASVFFQINPNLLLPTFDLESFGIEIISEEDDGFIIGASSDNFRTLEEKIAGFINVEYSTARIADLWKIIDGERKDWRPQHILSQELFSKWSTINDNDNFKLEVSIAFAKPIGAQPDATKKGGPRRLAIFQQQQEDRDDALRERETKFEEFVNFYGSITSSIVHLEDSFSAQIEISGKGLKDLVENYPFVFEVNETEEISIDYSFGEDQNSDPLEILPPLEGAPIIGVIDSGIMEGHKYLASAIDPVKSISYLVSDTSTADYAPNGGHGTKVAGAILFPNGVSTLGSPYILPCYIRNLRVLNDRNSLEDKYPAQLMQKIVEDNRDCKIYNLSVTSKSQCRIRHMSSWAAMIDKLTHQNNVLFIAAVGNISTASIRTYLQRSENYPNYLENPFCRIANPSQSSFAISVGSVDCNSFEDVDWKSIGGKDNVSGYSRIGHGIWGHVKPDLVEFGGEIIVSKNGLSQIKVNVDTCTELTHSTVTNNSAIGKSSFGTSFSTPKVSHIAALLKSLYPDESNNLIRALLVQGARLPGDLFYNPTSECVRHLGYGIPSIDRVIRNSEYRATFYNTNSIAVPSAHIYSLRIPQSIRDPGNDFDILIEVTLSFTAEIRRTRQKLKSYLGTWLDWTSSKLGERFDVFSERAIKQDANSENEDGESGEVIQWKIREQSNYGSVIGINRNQNSLQKDWVILKSYQLPEELSFAVRAHKGWDKNFGKIPYAFTVSIEVLGSEIPIYEEIKIENQVEINIETENRIEINIENQA
jgi:Subtilase family